MVNPAAPGDYEDSVQVHNLSRLTTNIVAVGLRPPDGKLDDRSSDLSPEDGYVLPCFAQRHLKEMGRVYQDNGTCGALPHRLVATVHLRDVGQATAFRRAKERAATEATIGTNATSRITDCSHLRLGHPTM